MEIVGEEYPIWDPSGEKMGYKAGELDYLYGSLGPARTVSDAIKKSKVNRGPFYVVGLGLLFILSVYIVHIVNI